MKSYTGLCEEYMFRWVGEDFIWLAEYDSAKFYLESALRSGDVQMFVPRFQAYLALTYYKTKQYKEMLDTYHSGIRDE